MVSPLASIVAGVRSEHPLAGIAGTLNQSRATNSQLETDALRRQQVKSQVSAEESLATAKYLNSLGKSLLSKPESEWQQILSANLPRLQSIGYSPDILRGATREQIESVVAQTEPLANAEGLSIERDKLRQRELEREQRDRHFKEKSGELKPGVQKILDSSQNEAVESAARSRMLGLLADDLERAGDIGGGKGSTFSEFLKTQLGTQDDVTEFRRRYNAIRSSEAVQNLPPGVASDKDIELALKGFPAENAPKEQLLAFLRGAQKLASFRARFNEEKSRFISETGSTRGLLQALKDVIPDVTDTQAAQPKLFSSILNREVSEQDIQDTLDSNPGLTREQLLQQLGINDG